MKVLDQVRDGGGGGTHAICFYELSQLSRLKSPLLSKLAAVDGQNIALRPRNFQGKVDATAAYFWGGGGVEMGSIVVREEGQAMTACRISSTYILPLAVPDSQPLQGMPCTSMLFVYYNSTQSKPSKLYRPAPVFAFQSFFSTVSFLLQKYLFG
jgi:hypothetical protein